MVCKATSMSSACGVFPMVFFSQITHRPVRVRATCFSAAFVPCALNFSKPQLNRGFRRISCSPDYQLWLRRYTDKPFPLCRNASFDDYASGVPSVSSSLGTLGLVRCVELEAAWPIRAGAQARQARLNGPASTFEHQILLNPRHTIFSLDKRR